VTYGVRVRATDVAGNVQPWTTYAQTSTLADTQEPAAWILPFDPYVTDADQFTVYWAGDSSPNTTITSYSVRWNFRNGSWTMLVSNTTQTQQLFTDLYAQDGWYCFEVTASDSAGRTSPYMGQQCTYVDRNPPYLETVGFLPIAANDGQY
jgi:hypothetical protein